MSARKSTDTSEKTKGSIMEAIGKLVGDPKVEAEGKSKQKLSKAEAKLKPTPTA